MISLDNLTALELSELQLTRQLKVAVTELVLFNSSTSTMRVNCLTPTLKSQTNMINSNTFKSRKKQKKKSLCKKKN